MVMVGESWNPDLRLSLGRSTDPSPPESMSSSRSSGMDESFGDSTHHWQQQQRRKKITMFYNGRIGTCDVTEMQANTILSMAMRGMDDTTPKNNQHQDKYQQQQQQWRVAQSSPPPATAAAPPQALEQLHQPGLSMKRSLQRFLQKRKSRIGDVSPYAHRKQQLLLFPIKS